MRSAVFFVYVWPEPRSSAAGVRTYALMKALLQDGWKVHAVSPSGDSPHRSALHELGIQTHTCDPNNSATDSTFSTLTPHVAIFDRFVMEEQFGWRAREAWPMALTIVDTQDLHSVRRARETLALKEAPLEQVLNPSFDDLGIDLYRELGSLYRCDFALVVSSWEQNFLISRCNISPTRLLHLAFPSSVDEQVKPFSERNGFCFLGNFRHPPNLDSVRYTLRGIWPEIRKQLPQAEFHLYGAYPPAEISAHKGAHGVYAHGPIHDHREALRKHRILLSPLRFGAGIKGKVLEAWGTGTPVAGTALTFEGMGLEQLSVEEAVKGHENSALWNMLSMEGVVAIRSNYDQERLARSFLQNIEAQLSTMTESRAANIIGGILRHHSSNSTKYFSKWIEAKNRNGDRSPTP